jgi:hypothetical protein
MITSLRASEIRRRDLNTSYLKYAAADFVPEECPLFKEKQPFMLQSGNVGKLTEAEAEDASQQSRRS